MAISVEELAVQQAETNALARENKHRIEKLEDITSILTDVKVSLNTVDERQAQMSDTLERLDKKVEAIEEKPAKRWETVVGALLGGLAVAFIGWVLMGAPGLK